MKKIQLKGDVVSDYVGKLLDWFELDSIYPEKVRHMLENAGNEDVEITLTTNGGSVFAGQEIYDVIKNYEGKTTARLSGLVASIGTLITCAFDEVLISPVATFMIHNPTLADVSGEKKDMEKAAQLLTTVENCILDAYVAKTGLDKEGLADLMDKETFMTAQETIDYGFADGMVKELENEVQLVAGFETLANSSFIKKLQNMKDKEERDLAEAKLRFLRFKEDKK
ncbi:Clp protease ClpP [Enterococcus faecalis]|uniref:head maturation protease, ClpP-related n=1 Tax=Enterococcus faecalis TaxID=1351 RepID=UPI001A96E1B9|nr:head maturation protease, ClpP-related [Enterococcus faecalis]EIR4022250.1 Clp protease ClpP [Enterococcus faecalis]MBO1105060.1 Clp protease ClpP [Enterococcus faecalis]MCE2556763.1 Clp protease ClpP [Enterococcus faecalis]MDN3202430.1 Clp protease ClpP [Enterococcus faecalis]